MRIAVSIENQKGMDSSISFHFGRCPFYAIVKAENDEINLEKIIKNPYYENHGGPGQVPEFIRDQDVDVMIAGGMGGRAVSFFQRFDIETVTGAQGTVKEAVEAYLSGDMSGTEPCSHDSGKQC